MTSGFCRARWLFSLFALAAVTGYFGAVWAGGYGLRLELGWKTSQYFFNYQDLGFVKRALIGTILHPFPALQRIGWLFTMADSFDGQGALWRFNWINTYYLPGPNVFNQTTAFYHDLNSGNYSVYDMMQGKPQYEMVDAPGVDYAKPEFYSLDNLKSAGY